MWFGWWEVRKVHAKNGSAVICLLSARLPGGNGFICSPGRPRPARDWGPRRMPLEREHSRGQKVACLGVVEAHAFERRRGPWGFSLYAGPAGDSAAYHSRRVRSFLRHYCAARARLVAAEPKAPVSSRGRRGAGVPNVRWFCAGWGGGDRGICFLISADSQTN